MTRPVFTHRITARPEHIDELGHVNNAVWVQWIQEVALAHWYSVAAPEHQQRYLWVVVRHEIEYLRAAVVGPSHLDAAMTLLGTLPAAALAARTGLTERRIRQLAAGVALVEAARNRYGLSRMMTADASLREGAIHAADRAGDDWPEHLSALIGDASG